jgi:hypothetical protein
VQHFWLCNACSESYTLEYRGDGGAVIKLRLTCSQELR